MDLGAYIQTEKLEQVAKDNGIKIPRLRGYRLMKDESPVLQTEIKELQSDIEISIVKHLCESQPFWSPNAHYYTINDRTEKLRDYFLVKESNEKSGLSGFGYVGVRWDRIHGRKRKVLKFMIKKKKRMIQKQFDIWNKYVGREDVLYIHSRMGGNNWKYYKDKTNITGQPWFLDRVDDYDDSTYCDFYAKIK